MRISLTDRCKLRCRFCASPMPNRVENEKLPNFEKTERLVRVGCELGISEYSVLFQANGYASQELKTKTTEDVNHDEVI